MSFKIFRDIFISAPILFQKSKLKTFLQKDILQFLNHFAFRERWTLRLLATRYVASNDLLYMNLINMYTSLVTLYSTYLQNDIHKTITLFQMINWTDSTRQNFEERLQCGTQLWSDLGSNKESPHWQASIFILTATTVILVCQKAR